MLAGYRDDQRAVTCDIAQTFGSRSRWRSCGRLSGSRDYRLDLDSNFNLLFDHNFFFDHDGFDDRLAFYNAFPFDYDGLDNGLALYDRLLLNHNRFDDPNLARDFHFDRLDDDRFGRTRNCSDAR